MRAIATPLLASALALGLAVSSGACSRRADAPAQAAPAQAASAQAAAPVVPEVSVDELDQLLASHQGVAVDANEDTTRQRMGVIPGAVLLRDMGAVDQLPADKTTGLVFYCANRACRASHEAAEKALAAGYTHVRELPDGIAGWVKAGKQTRSI